MWDRSSVWNERWVGGLWTAGLMLSVIAVYAPAAGHPFHWDDRIFLADDNVVSGRWERLVEPPVPRWLTWLVFSGQYQLFGRDPGPFHVFSVLLHAVNSLLVLLLLRRLLGQGSTEGTASTPASLHAAGAGAALFAFHPIQTESVLYIYQQSTLLSALLSLLSLNLWIRDRRLPALLLVLPAVAAKETALALPPVFWLADGLLRRRWRPSAWTVAAVAGAGAGVLLVFLSGRIGSDPTLGGSRLAYLASQVPVFTIYLQRVLAPVNLNLDPDVPLPPDLFRPSWWFALLAVAGVGIALVWVCRRDPRLGFLAWLFPLFLLPSSSLIPSQDPMSEHRLYLSMVAVAGIAGVLMARRSAQSWSLQVTAGGTHAWRRRAAIAVPCVVLGVSIGLDLVRIRVWQDEIALWQDTVRKSPHKFRPHYNLGVLLMDRDPAEAYVVLSEAIRIDPSQPMAYRSLGEVFWRQHRYPEAERAWRQALALDPDHAGTCRALGLLYARQGAFSQALHHLQRARELDPLAWRSYFDLAGLHYRFGFMDTAVEHCEAGLRLHPENTELRLLLAELMMQTRNFARAAELYQGNIATGAGP